jgi:4-amino-4-deoxy-L-arabinose transferase-like glycosyltransferase
MKTATGLHRLFITEMANEISWLLPAALFATAFGGYLAVRGRLDRDEWAAVVSWGGWLLLTGAVFSYMRGTIHPYYTVALAPAIGALVGLGTVWAWRSRAALDGRIAMVSLIVLSASWSSVLLRHNHFGSPWLPAAITTAGGAAAIGILAGRRRPSVVGSVAGLTAALAGTVVFSVATVATPHHGAIPNAVNLTRPHERLTAGGWTGDEATNGELAAMLAATTTPWSAATNGSQSAAALELATRTSVMAIGGWSGDPTPTLDQFIGDVHAGRVTYYVEAGRGGSAQPQGRVIRSENHSASHAREIADWVADHYPAITVGTSLVYRLV